MFCEERSPERNKTGSNEWFERFDRSEEAQPLEPLERLELLERPRFIEPVAVDRSILWIRGRRVVLAADLAKIYGVETRVLNQAVKRNRDRFPEDFTFRLTRDEAIAVAASRSQSVILKRGENIKYLPYAFTEHGAIMAANTLNSRHAVRMSVYVVRAFIRLRATVELQREVKLKLDELERAVTAHDTSIKTLFAVVRQLMASPEPKKRKIGFLVEERAARYGKR